MLKEALERVRSRRSPEARRARAARRRSAWSEAVADVEIRDRRHGPSPTEVEQRSLRGERPPRT